MIRALKFELEKETCILSFPSHGVFSYHGMYSSSIISYKRPCCCACELTVNFAAVRRTVEEDARRILSAIPDLVAVDLHVVAALRRDDTWADKKKYDVKASCAIVCKDTCTSSWLSLLNSSKHLVKPVQQSHTHLYRFSDSS